MRQGFKKYSDMRQGYFLKSTGDIALNKRQRHATLAFLKIDRRHGDPPSRAPNLPFKSNTNGCLHLKQTRHTFDNRDYTPAVVSIYRPIGANTEIDLC